VFKPVEETIGCTDPRPENCHIVGRLFNSTISVNCVVLINITCLSMLFMMFQYFGVFLVPLVSEQERKIKISLFRRDAVHFSDQRLGSTFVDSIIGFSGDE